VARQRGSRTRWTPRARRLAAIAFGLLALLALGAGLVGAFCGSPSLDCVRGSARNVLRVAVLVVPLLAYAVYRLTRGGGE
jgi:hypothetical protein